MHDPRESYKATTLRILGSFQLLEFALKGYIGVAYSIIRKSVGENVHFGYSAEDVEEYPLERLINVFAKLNANKQLISRLNKLRVKRNHIAHKSLLITMGRLYDQGEVDDRYMEYFELDDELTECLQEVINESRILKNRLDTALVPPSA